MKKNIFLFFCLFLTHTSTQPLSLMQKKLLCSLSLVFCAALIDNLPRWSADGFQQCQKNNFFDNSYITNSVCAGLSFMRGVSCAGFGFSLHHLLFKNK